MRRRLLFILAAFAGALVPANAQILSCVGPQDRVAEYSRADFDITLKGNWENPYRQQEVTLDMMITAPDGTLLVLPCFHIEGESGEESHWQARFTPRQCGTYTYTFIYREKGEVESAGCGGVIRAVPSDGKGMLNLNDNWTFRFDNGELFRGIGENICWESRKSDDSKFFSELHQQESKYNYDYMLPLFASCGGNFIRVWMCGWNFPIDKKDHFNNVRYTPTDKPINRSAVERLDHMMELCESLGIEVMLCMGAGEARTDERFFTSDEAKAEHRNRLRYIIARWGYSTSLAMWEFFNEIDNIQFRQRGKPIPHEAITQWHAEMAKYVKGLDPFGHMVTTSISHRDVKGMNDVPDMDINQKHIYCNTRDIPGTISGYEAAHGKPYIIGECGYEWDWSKNFNDFADGMDWDFRKCLWYGLVCPTPVTPMSWWWEFFENRGMMRYIKPVREISDLMLESGKGEFDPLSLTAPDVEMYAVKCGPKVFVYFFNDSDKSVKVDAMTRHGWKTAGEYDIDKCAMKKAGKPSVFTLKPHNEKLFVVDL